MEGIVGHKCEMMTDSRSGARWREPAAMARQRARKVRNDGREERKPRERRSEEWAGAGEQTGKWEEEDWAEERNRRMRGQEEEGDSRSPNGGEWMTA